MIEQRDPGDENDWQSRLEQGWQFVGTEDDSLLAHRRGEAFVKVRGGEYRVFPEDAGYELRWRPMATKGGH